MDRLNSKDMDQLKTSLTVRTVSYVRYATIWKNVEMQKYQPDHDQHTPSIPFCFEILQLLASVVLNLSKMIKAQPPTKDNALVIAH